MSEAKGPIPSNFDVGSPAVQAAIILAASHMVGKTPAPLADGSANDEYVAAVVRIANRMRDAFIDDSRD